MAPRSSKTRDTSEPLKIEFSYDGRAYSEEITEGLMLRELTPLQIKNYLNQIPGKIAYYKALASEVDFRLDEKRRAFEVWFGERYLLAKKSEEKATEGFLKNKVIVDNAEKYNTLQREIAILELTRGKLDALYRGYDASRTTLTTIGNITRTEMDHQPIGSGAGGHGSLTDL